MPAGHPGSLLPQSGRCPKTVWCALVCDVDLLVLASHQCNASSNSRQALETRATASSAQAHSLREVCYHERSFLWTLPLRSLLSVSTERPIFHLSIGPRFAVKYKVYLNCWIPPSKSWCFIHTLPDPSL